MNSLNPETKYLKVQITTSEIVKAKSLAKSKGMTLKGWLGQLIKHELHSAGLDTPVSEEGSGDRSSLCM